MENNVLPPAYQRLECLFGSTIDAVLAGPRWKCRILAVVVALSLLRAFPSYDALSSSFVQTKWRDVQVKFDHPLLDTSRIFPPASHESNLTFRLTIPLLAHEFRLHETGVLILSGFAGLLLFYQILRVVFSISGSKRLALFICLAVACAWPGETAFHELRGGYYDAVALCLLVSALATSSSVLTFSFVFLAAWTDERALVVSPFLLLFHLVGTDNQSGFHYNRAAAIVLAVLTYVGTRTYLSEAHPYAAGATGIGFSVLQRQTNVIPLAIWTGLTASWAIVLLGAIALFLQRRHPVAIAFSAALLAAITLSLTAVDVTRSIAYCLPAIFVALSALYRTEPVQQIEKLAGVIALVSFLVPTYYVEGSNGLWWLYPFPIQIARWLAMTLSARPLV